MNNNYFKRNPIKNWTIAKECQPIFLNTIEKQERWESIKAKNQPVQIVSTPVIQNMKLNLN